MARSRILVLFAFCIVSQAGYAQIYKCEDAQGKLNFTDQPCPHSPADKPIRQAEEASRSPQAVPENIPAEDSAAVTAELTASDYLPHSVKLKARRLLEERRYRDLNVQLALYHAAAVANPVDEQEFFTAYASFDYRGPAYRKSLDLWVEATPDAYQPYLARAYHSYGLAWAARGELLGSETSTTRISAMQRHFSDVRRDLAAATERGAPALIPSVLNMGMWMTKGSGDDAVPKMMKRAQDKDPKEMTSYLMSALAESPASYEIREHFIYALYPRWGGSHEAMAGFSKQSQEFVKQNPRIALLGGAVYADIAFNTMNDGAYTKADTLYAKALEYGEKANVLKYRGVNSYKQKKYAEALGYFNQAISAYADEGDVYYRRSSAYRKLGKLDDALADYERKVLLDSLDEDAQGLRDALTLDLHKLAHQHSNQRDYRRAVEVYGNLLELNDRYLEGHYGRAWSYYKLGEYNSALVDIKNAIELDPVNYNSYLLLDNILVQRRDWAQIIHYWNAYIALEPNNADAYFERHGTYLHYGDQAASLRDLKKAADLGHAEARARYEELKARSTSSG